MPNRATAGLFAGLLLAACQSGGTPASVQEARVTLPAAPGVPGAGYFVLKGGRGDALTGVTSPAAERIEMHETGTDARGVTSMRPVPEVPLNGADIAFEPGGKHLMLFGLRDGLQPGQSIPLTLRFRTAPAVTVDARLAPPGGGHNGH